MPLSPQNADYFEQHRLEASGKCKLKVAAETKRFLCFLCSGLQTTDPTHVCQCRQLERTRAADRVDVGVSDGTHTPFADSDKPPTAVLISNARQMLVASSWCRIT